MRTASLLSIAGILGIALLAVILWSGSGGRDVAIEGPPLELEASGRDGVRATTAREATESGTASAGLESTAVASANDLPSNSDRLSRASAPPVAQADRSFALVRETLAAAIERHLPGHVLSESQLDDLARATLRLRSAQAALRTIPKTREHADQRAFERRRLEGAVADFTYLLEMTPAEFTRRVDPEGGIDVWSPDEEPDDLSIRPIRPTRASETSE